MNTSTLLCLTALALSGVGCAGAQTDLTAGTARYPISLSGALIDPDGKPVYSGEDLEVVGAFSGDATKVGFVYGLTGIDYDLSDEVNEQVAAAGGEGIVRLQATAEQCALNYFFPLTLLPIWPGCANVAVSGEIVRRKKDAGEVAPAEGEPSPPPPAETPPPSSVEPVLSEAPQSEPGPVALGGGR